MSFLTLSRALWDGQKVIWDELDLRISEIASWEEAHNSYANVHSIVTQVGGHRHFIGQSVSWLRSQIYRHDQEQRDPMTILEGGREPVLQIDRQPVPQLVAPEPIIAQPVRSVAVPKLAAPAPMGPPPSPPPPRRSMKHKLQFTHRDRTISESDKVFDTEADAIEAILVIQTSIAVHNPSGIEKIEILDLM